MRLESDSSTLGSCSRALASAALATVLLSAACSSDPALNAAGGAGSVTPPAGAGTTASGSSGSPAIPGGGGASSSGGGAPPAASGTAGLLDTSGAGAGTVPSAGTTGTAGAATVPVPTNMDHCLKGFDPQPSDNTMASGPAVFKSAGNGDDTILQPEVLQWMSDNKWTGAHVLWHAVRGCADGSAAGLLNPLGYKDICKDYPVLIPTDQNCKTAGDGYQFLLFHRHMLQALRQLWPSHAADFDGFPKFPTTKA